MLVPFHVERGKYFAADLQASDFILREDGHPRPFTTFEGPHTEHPLPLELILLFDTTPKAPHELRMFPWDPARDYEFLDNWDESITREVLQTDGMDIRIAVYHYSLHQLERLCAATSDPREIVHAFHALLDPIPPGKGELTLLPGNRINKPLFGPPTSGWLIESIAGTLKDAGDSSLVPARRLLIVFSAGGSGTYSFSDPYGGIVNPALAMNIPINPVFMNVYKQSGAISPRGSGEWYSGLLPWWNKAGDMTGGRSFVPHDLDRETMAGILGLVRDTALSQYLVGFSPESAARSRKALAGGGAQFQIQRKIGLRREGRREVLDIKCVN